MRQHNRRAVPGLDVAGDGLALMLSNFMMLETNQSMKPTQLLICALGVSAAIGSMCSARAQSAYAQHNLVSDVAGLADHTDPNLLNPWGIAFSATSPFWISDNHSGLSTLYNGSGTPNFGRDGS